MIYQCTACGERAIVKIEAFCGDQVPGEISYRCPRCNEYAYFAYGHYEDNHFPFELVKAPPKTVVRPFVQSFDVGKSYFTKRGQLCRIVAEQRTNDHCYDTVQGEDGLWRYDRHGDRGRITGQRDPECLDNLIPNTAPHDTP